MSEYTITQGASGFKVTKGTESDEGYEIEEFFFSCWEDASYWFAEEFH